MEKGYSVYAAFFLLVFTLSGCGGGGGAAPPGNTAPVADAGSDQQVGAGDTVTLDGSGSSDADNDPLTYKWSFSEKPSGSNTSLSDAAATKPTFTPDKGGVYVLALVVNDGTVDSAADQVTVRVLSLPDTGQIGDYTATFGEDSDYSINPPSYTDNGDGTVTDNITGLMWQKTDDGNTYNWYQASGTADATHNPGGANVCGTLTDGGHHDWRLPTRMELMSIADYGAGNPAIDTAFQNTASSLYWSLTTYADNSSLAWGVYFNDGSGDAIFKQTAKYVRCVRSFAQMSSSFTDNGDNTVTDSATGLMWQQTEGGIMTWEEALNYCENLSLAGHDDWRMPNIKELAALIDYTRVSPAIDATAFPYAVSDMYWSSTTYSSSNTYAWYVDFSYGGSGSILKSSSIGYIRCVR